MVTLNEATDLARQAVKSGDAIRYRIEDGCLDVETDQGWRQWFPEPESNHALH